MPANIFDIVVLILLGVAAITGFFKGLITMVTSLAALLLGAWLSMKFSYVTGGFLTGKFSLDGQYVTTLSFIITFLIVVIGVHLLGKTIGTLAKAIALGGIDKILGMVFGILKSAFIISTIVAALNSFRPSSELFSDQFKEDSFCYGLVQPIAPFIFNQLNFDIESPMPSDIMDAIGDEGKII